jgi:hypothetical protein
VSTDAAGRWISLPNVNREDHFSISKLSKPVTRLGQAFMCLAFADDYGSGSRSDPYFFIKDLKKFQKKFIIL